MCIPQLKNLKKNLNSPSTLLGSAPSLHSWLSSDTKTPGLGFKNNEFSQIVLFLLPEIAAGQMEEGV